MRVDVLLQAIEPRMLLGIRYVVVQIGGRRSGAARVDEAEALVEAHVLDQLHGLVEIRIGLAGEADDEVRADRDVRAHRAQLAQLLLELQRGVAALHRREHAVAARLHRQVQEVRELGHVAIGLDQRVAELQRMRSGEADAADAVDFGDGADQQREVRDLALAIRAAVGVDVLAEQVDLAHALRGELRDFDQHVLERAADFGAAGVGHHAEAAVLAAAFHDRDERARAFGARLGQAVELLDLGEADVDLRLAGFAPLANEFGQAVQGLRAEHQVDVGRALDDAFAFLRGHAAADPDQHRPVALFQRLPAAELAEHLFLRLLADGAGVDQDHVRLGGVVGQFQAFVLGENVGHLRRIVFVHLATVCFDEHFPPAGRSGCGGGRGNGLGLGFGHVSSPGRGGESGPVRVRELNKAGGAGRNACAG